MRGRLPASSLAESLGSLYDALPLGVVLAGVDNELAYANREFFSLTECTARDLEFMNFEDVLSMFCLGICQDPGALDCPEGRWHAMEKYIRRRDGDNAWVRVHISRVSYGGTQLRQLLVEDVTRYKEAADALIDRKNLYESIVETRPDPICCFLPDWSLTYVNASFCRCVRRRDRDLVGENLLALLPEAARDAFGRAADSLSADRPAVEVEHELSLPGEDRPRWMRWVIQGFFYPTGHIKDYQAIGMDISEQKITESNVLHAERLVSLGTLVSGVAHEVNNPNNFIMLNAPLVLDIWTRVAPALERLAAQGGAPVAGGVPLDDMLGDMPRLVQGIIEGSHRIRNYVRELKNYARQDTESGFELLSVNDVVQSAVLLMSRTIARYTARFSVRYAAGLPLVRGRRQRLEQIVINLVQNACLALDSPERGIFVETEIDEPGGTVRIVVRDEGAGIRPEDLARVTDPFYSTRRDQGGTGLGLSVSLSIAREHGGRLLMESVPGEGTCASVILPAAGPAAGSEWSWP